MAKEIAELADGVPNIQKEMKNFQVIMINQNNKLEALQQNQRLASLFTSFFASRAHFWCYLHPFIKYGA